MQYGKCTDKVLSKEGEETKQEATPDWLQSSSRLTSERGRL
jgi:hypothetical protein